MGMSLYQPMNWLATLIPSLRDFTRDIIAFTRPKGLTRHNMPTSRPYGTFTRAYGTLHGATRPYTPRRGFTRCASTLTRGNAALHGTTCPHPVPTGLSPPPFPLLSQLRASALSTARKRFSTSAAGASQLRHRLEDDDEVPDVEVEGEQQKKEPHPAHPPSQMGDLLPFVGPQPHRWLL